MARKRLVPSPGYGQSLYDAIKQQRRADGSQWEAEDLCQRLAAIGVRISAKQIREWIKRGRPGLATAMAIAGLFGVTLDEMWKGTAKPINLPQDAPKPTPRPAGAAADADPFQNAGRAQRHTAAAKASRHKPGRRRSGS